MPKTHTFPTLYDEVLTLNISKLKEWGYLEPDKVQNGTVHWTSNYNKSSITIQVNTFAEQPYIILSYNYGGEPCKYKVYFTFVPSNLGKGKLWYFICPHTGKRCRKLYLVGGFFFHREAFNGCMYDCQKMSKKVRQMIAPLKTSFQLDKYYNELYQKHFKKTYAGKPTKRYLKLMEKIEKVESIPLGEIERALMS